MEAVPADPCCARNVEKLGERPRKITKQHKNESPGLGAAIEVLRINKNVNLTRLALINSEEIVRLVFLIDSCHWFVDWTFMAQALNYGNTPRLLEETISVGQR